MEKTLFDKITSKYKKGTYINATWYSNPSVKASFKNKYDVVKTSQNNVRLGINQLEETQENVFVNEKGNIRVHLTKNKKHKPHTSYVLIDLENGELKDISKEELIAMDIIIPSYWNRTTEDLEWYWVKLEKLIKLGK